MALTDGKRATIAGAIVGGSLLALFVYRKVGDLTNQATVMQASLQTRAQEMVEAEAEASVYTYMGQNFGLTPERIAGVERLIQRVGL